MFKRAIVRTPCPRITEGITTANLGEPIYEKALEQHAAYIEALKDCGVEVIVLEADNDHPDSTFVEDTALLTPHCAVITRPGAPSRQGEVTVIEHVVKDYYETLETIVAPGSVEAGDIMMVGSHFYIGLSDRTNQAGAAQMIAALERHGMSGETVTLTEVLHLKTGISYLENNNLLVSGEFLKKEALQKFNLIAIDDDEQYAANCIWVNGTVIVPEGYPKTRSAIEMAGYPTLAVDVSEFRKIDGGLSWSVPEILIAGG